MDGGSLNFQCNGIVAVSPGRSFFLFGTKTSRPASLEYKVMRAGSKNFASGLLGVMVSGTTLIPTP